MISMFTVYMPLKKRQLQNLGINSSGNEFCHPVHESGLVGLLLSAWVRGMVLSERVVSNRSAFLKNTTSYVLTNEWNFFFLPCIILCDFSFPEAVACLFVDA